MAHLLLLCVFGVPVVSALCTGVAEFLVSFPYPAVEQGRVGAELKGVLVAWAAARTLSASSSTRKMTALRYRLSTAIQRHIVLVMAALAICAVTAAQLKDRTGTQHPPPVTPDQVPPPDPGMIPLVLSAHPTEPSICPGQLTIGGCPARRLSAGGAGVALGESAWSVLEQFVALNGAMYWLVVGMRYST